MGISKQQLVNTVEQMKTYTDSNDEEIKDRINQLVSLHRYTDSKLSFCLYGGTESKVISYISGEDITKLLMGKCYANESILVDDANAYIELKAGSLYRLEAFVWSYTSGAALGKPQFWSWYNKDTGDLIGVSSLNVRTSDYASCEPTVAFIRPQENIKVGIKSIVTGSEAGNISIYGQSSYFSIEETGKAIVLDPLNYVNDDTGIEDSPVGQIISFMGTVAPKHYRICDGATYSIADYPLLAEHFKTQFGSSHYFGGDGTTTFAVPDLRNEFIRGFHGEAAEQLSGEIGKHQDATIHTNICTNGVANIITHEITHNGDNETFNTRNADLITVSGKTRYVASSTTTAKDARGFDYTSRPTNVAVLYCIKYEPTYYMNIASYGYEKETVFDGKLSYIGKTEIPSLERYDFIQVVGVLAHDSTSNLYNHKSSLMIHKDDILKRDTSTVSGAFLLCGSAGNAADGNRRIGFGFEDYTHIAISGINGDGYICSIYGYKRKNQIEKSDNRETQSVLVEGTLSEADGATTTLFDYPNGYNDNNCIIRAFNVMGTGGWHIPHQFDNYVQLKPNKLAVYNTDSAFKGAKFQIELAKKSSVVYQAKDPLEGKRIMLCGDSILFGTGWEGGWGNLISENHDCTVLNCAAAGSTLADGYISYLLEEGLKQMPEPDYLILDGGGNDMFRGNDFGTFERYVYPTDYDSINKTTALGYLEAIFFILRNTLPRTKVIFVIPYPILTEDASYQVQDEKYELLRNLCKKYCVPVVDYFIISNLVPNNGVQHEAFMYDWLHINEAGYRHLYPQLEKELMNL